MKKLLLSLAAAFVFSSTNAQITILNENFDSFPDFAITGFGQWQTLDIDLLPTYIGGLPTGGTTWLNGGDPQAFIIFNPTAAGVNNNATVTADDNEVRNFDPHSGLKYAACWAAVPSTTGGATANNDWLISPAITLGLTGNNLSFWVKSLSSTYGLDKYKVGIYVGSGTPTSSANFTIISGATALSAPYGTWQQKTFALDSYAGQTVRIGIQGVSADVYMLMVDDVTVTATTLGTSEVSNTDFSLYPNPTKGDLSIKSKYSVNFIRIYDESGKLVKENYRTNGIDISNAPTGVYYMNISLNNGKVHTQKIIKQ